MPAILIEIAFITNVNDAEILVNKQDDIVKGIIKGICKYLGIEYKESTDVLNKHWANKYLNNLVSKGIIDVPEKWKDFDESLSSRTIGELLALVDKVSNR